MLKIEHKQVDGWEAAIRGMRNPLNSWAKSDSGMAVDEYYYDYFEIGDNDYSLMMKLRNAGTDHRKFLRMIVVSFDCTAPLYWWKEFDTYKVGTVTNSCSTMHRIHSKEITMDDFSHEHLLTGSMMMLHQVVDLMNEAREKYLETKEMVWWHQMIQLLPTSYNQRRTVMLNYEVLANIYKSRKNHKLQEWHTFCEWIESLPYSELIIGGEEK
jgi:hypothetical protein